MYHRGTRIEFHVVIKNGSHYAEVQEKMPLNDEVKVADRLQSFKTHITVKRCVWDEVMQIRVSIISVLYLKGVSLNCCLF